MSRPCARAGRAPSRPAGAPGPACRPLRSSGGTPRRPIPRPRRAPCGSTPSACAGSTRAAGARRPAARRRGSLPAPAARRGARVEVRARAASRSVTSSVSSRLILSSQAEVGRVARRVGQRPRPRDGAQERTDARVRSTQVEDLLDHRAVLALEGTHVLVVGLRVLVDANLDAEGPGGVCVGGTRHSARDPLDGDGGAAPGDAHALDHVGNGADGRELTFGAGNQQDALLLPGLDGDRRRHAREQDGVVQRDKNQVFHGASFQIWHARNDYSHQRLSIVTICR